MRRRKEIGAIVNSQCELTQSHNESSLAMISDSYDTTRASDGIGQEFKKEGSMAKKWAAMKSITSPGQKAN
jgi:hypothetical protein